MLFFSVISLHVSGTLWLSYRISAPCFEFGKCSPWLFLNYDDVIQSPLIQCHVGFWEKKEAMWGLWFCLKISLRILKHSNDDDNDDSKNSNNNNNNNNNDILRHSTAHSDLLSECFEGKYEFQCIRKVKTMMLLFLRTSSLICFTPSAVLSVFGHPECPEFLSLHFCTQKTN